MLGMNITTLSISPGLGICLCCLEPCSVRARYHTLGRMLGTQDFMDPDSLGARLDGVGAALTLMNIAGAGEKLSAQPPSRGACSVQLSHI